MTLALECGPLVPSYCTSFADESWYSDQFIVHIFSVVASSTAMSNPNGLLGQKSCRYLNQGRTFDDILMKAAH